jgi:hypothetical protein
LLETNEAFGTDEQSLETNANEKRETKRVDPFRRREARFDY